jgi:hypothetical protein
VTAEACRFLGKGKDFEEAVKFALAHAGQVERTAPP